MQRFSFTTLHIEWYVKKRNLLFLPFLLLDTWIINSWKKHCITSAKVVMFSPMSVCLMVCWLACRQDNTKTASWLSRELWQKIGLGPEWTLLTFGAYVDIGTDLRMFPHFFNIVSYVISSWLTSSENNLMLIQIWIKTQQTWLNLRRLLGFDGGIHLTECVYVEVPLIWDIIIE